MTSGRQYNTVAIAVSLILAGLVAIAYVLAVGPRRGPGDGCHQFYEQGLKAAYGFRENMNNSLEDIYLREALLWLAVHQSCTMEEGRR